MAGAGKNFKPDDDLIAPLDFLILGGLSEEGTTFNGAYPLGQTARQLSHDVFAGEIRSSLLGPRMNTLKYHGLIISIRGIGTNGARMYQRTKKGKEVYEEWLATRGVKA